jgi:hypothetical protein
MERCTRKVLEVSVKDHTKVSYLARELLRLGKNERLRFYNVDVTVSQAYLYDKDIFPFARVMVVVLENASAMTCLTQLKASTILFRTYVRYGLKWVSRRKELLKSSLIR